MIIIIKHFLLIFPHITDCDNHLKVLLYISRDSDNQSHFGLIILGAPCSSLTPFRHQAHAPRARFFWADGRDFSRLDGHDDRAREVLCAVVHAWARAPTRPTPGPAASKRARQAAQWCNGRGAEARSTTTAPEHGAPSGACCRRPRHRRRAAPGTAPREGEGERRVRFLFGKMALC